MEKILPKLLDKVAVLMSLNADRLLQVESDADFAVAIADRIGGDSGGGIHGESAVFGGVCGWEGL